MENNKYADRISFVSKSTKTPELVFIQKAKEIEDVTQQYIVGNVAEYDGKIESYDQLSAVATLAQTLTMPTIHKDIQNELGEVGEKNFTYEFFLTAPKLENYKFRILFFEYGISGYPLKVVLEQGIADEINATEESNYIFNINTEKELETVIDNILNTQRVVDIMQKIIDASNIIGKTVTIE